MLKKRKLEIHEWQFKPTKYETERKRQPIIRNNGKQLSMAYAPWSANLVFDLTFLYAKCNSSSYVAQCNFCFGVNISRDHSTYQYLPQLTTTYVKKEREQ